MQRRGFLAAILAAGSAPAIVKAASIMTINPRQGLIMPLEVGQIDRFRIVCDNGRPNGVYTVEAGEWPANRTLRGQTKNVHYLDEAAFYDQSGSLSGFVRLTDYQRMLQANAAFGIRA